jgi:hypothetical protein
MKLPRRRSAGSFARRMRAGLQHTLLCMGLFFKKTFPPAAPIERSEIGGQRPSACNQ